MPAHTGAIGTIGHYELLERLGEGGMGVVYRASDRTTGSLVALKQLRSSTRSKNDAALRVLFEREYHTLASLSHPRIIAAYEYGVADDGPFYTMELVTGDDLRRKTRLPFREVCAILRDVTSSLALLHAHRLVHRDLSPSNVRITAEGHAKLLDFGALAGFGPSATIVGTPGFVAPEVLYRLPLDQRTDLYSLGALAYYMLCGRTAYPARRIEDLPALWRLPPEPPSHWNSDVPAALDTLVLSLLKTDPIARPKNAAAVIDQLTLIGQLTPEEEHRQAAESYLLSGRLVGRDKERVWVKEQRQLALSGRGCHIVLEAANGAGKSRLLRELCVDAQLDALVALSCDARTMSNPFGVPIALGVQLATLCPEIARRAAERHARLLGHLSHDLVRTLDIESLAQLPDDPNERRAQFQMALHDWFVTVAASLPLQIAVDNIHAADEESLAFMAALSKRAPQLRLLSVVTQPQSAGAGEHKRRLRPLGVSESEELARSLFGEVANVSRVARLLHDRSSGNPRTYLDLVRLLVRRGIAQYVGGTWVLPLEVSESELPNRVEEILTERFQALSTDAREVCRALAVHARPVSLAQCFALQRGVTERETLRCLDELVAEAFLVPQADSYRFEHELVRTTILDNIDPDRRRALHARAGDALLAAAGDNIGLRVEGAEHLLLAGEQARGADILANAGRKFLRDRGSPEGVERVVKAMSTALEVYEQQGRSEYELAALMFPLLPLAFFLDRSVTLRYGERAVEIGLRITGLGLAQRLARYFGRRLGLIGGLLVASVQFARTKKHNLAFDLKEAIGSFCGIVPATVGTRNIHYDIEVVQRLTAALEPMRLFGDAHIACLMHEFARAQLMMGQSRESEALEVLEKLDRSFQQSSVVEVLGDAHWKSMYGGILYSLGILHPFRSGQGALEIATAMERLGVRVWSMAADQIRMLHHAMRGEAELEQRYHERVELYAVQGSTTWQAEMFWPVLLLEAQVLAGDPLAARRIWKQLERRSVDAPALTLYADAAQAAYLGIRGEWKDAITLYDRFLPRIAPRERVAWVSVRASFAETLNCSGQHARAKALMEETLSYASHEDAAFLGRWLEPQRQLALADAGLGNTADAVARVERLLEKHALADQPLLVGLLHKARAQIAIGTGDLAAFERHASAMTERFEHAENPALIAQCGRLEEQALRAGLPVGSSMASRLKRAATQIAAAADPRECAVRLIAAEAQARGAHLYAWMGGRLRRLAATFDEAPPQHAEDLLAMVLRRHAAPSCVADDDSQETAVESFEAQSAVAPVETQTRFEPLALTLRRGGDSLVIAGVLLESDDETRPLAPEFIGMISTALGEREQVA